MEEELIQLTKNFFVQMARQKILVELSSCQKAILQHNANPNEIQSSKYLLRASEHFLEALCTDPLNYVDNFDSKVEEPIKLIAEAVELLSIFENHALKSIFFETHRLLISTLEMHLDQLVKLCAVRLKLV